MRRGREATLRPDTICRSAADRLDTGGDEGPCVDIKLPSVVTRSVLIDAVDFSRVAPSSARRCLVRWHSPKETRACGPSRAKKVRMQLGAERG